MDKIRILKKGTLVWSISLQESVSFSRDVYIEVTNTIIGNEEYVFGKLINIFNVNRILPLPVSFGDKTNGELGSIPINKTIPYGRKIKIMNLFKKMKNYEPETNR